MTKEREVDKLINMKKIALINDMTGFGRCSIAVELPIISALKVQVCPLPTAILSVHTGFKDYFLDDYTDRMTPYIESWKKNNLHFDGIATGFLGSAAQIEIVSDFLEKFSAPTMIDPVMGDHGRLYASYNKEMCIKMRELLNEMHNWMSSYMKSFYTDDEEVQRGILTKETHTGYVTSNCVELAKDLKLNRHDTELAEIIGLFHDVGRFRQYSIYKTFNDADSEDHADLALKVIDELEFFKELAAKDFDVVKFAIQNHNKKVVAPTDDARKNLFAKLIRDADKLDIYRVLEPFLAQENVDKMPQFIKSAGNLVADISPDFVENFVTGNQADYRKIRTNGDRKIVRLMWLYDINFSWTMQKIVERGYIEKIVSNLPMDEKISEGVRRLKLHVEKKLSEGV